MKFKEKLASLRLCFNSVVFCVCFLIEVARSANLLPYGGRFNDTSVKCYESSSTAGIALPGDFQFYERQHSFCYVSCNGAISFSASLFDIVERNLEISGKDVIAIFYAPSWNSTIFYRTIKNDDFSTLWFSEKIKSGFGDFKSDEPMEIILVTWNDVGNAERTAVNAYQMALVVQPKETYAVFIYQKIEWVLSNSYSAQIGFFASDGQNKKMLIEPHENLIRLTNIDEPGMYVFKISGVPSDPPIDEDYDATGSESESCPPDPYKDKCPKGCSVVMDDNECSRCICSATVGEDNNFPTKSYSRLHSKQTNDVDSEFAYPDEDDLSINTPQHSRQILTTQQEGHNSGSPGCSIQDGITAGVCSANANCEAFGTAYCCKCQEGYFGNGIECLPIRDPMRLNGVIEGAINGKSIQRGETFAYVQTIQGQQHIAISKVEPEVAWSLLLLEPLSNVMGWLFATTMDHENFPNGFQLTGGNFTRNLNIHLGDRYSISIRQEFRDRQGQMNEIFNMKTIVSGTLPEFSAPPVTNIPAYEQVYRREQPGLIRAYSERYFFVKETAESEQKQYQITLDEKINYTDCIGKTKNSEEFQPIIVQFDSVRTQYSEKEKLIRFAFQSNVKSQDIKSTTKGFVEEDETQNEDPCLTGRHFCTKANMVCVRTSNSYRYKCECIYGYTLVKGNSSSSEDDNIQCVGDERNQVIFSPETSAGACIRHEQCHKWGECYFDPKNPSKVGVCQCRDWYVGDGIHHCGPPVKNETIMQTLPTLSPSKTVCRSDNECVENAECKFNPQSGYYECRCNKGFQGDGIDCTESSSSDETVSRSSVEKNSQRKECVDAIDCHVSAHCVLDSEGSDRYFCECLPGYVADGSEICRKNDCNPNESESCGTNERCIFDVNAGYFQCTCIEGHEKFDDKCIAIGERAVSRENKKCNCGSNSQCIETEGVGWKCICNPGYSQKSTENGFECALEQKSCFDLQDMCSPNAKCIPDNTHRSYVCSCNFGYQGNGITCNSIPQATVEANEVGGGGNQILLMGRGMSIIQMALGPSDSWKQITIIPHQVVVSIDYDCVSDRIYWSDVSGHTIHSAFINGSDVLHHFADELRSPEGIAIDWSSRNIYYADSMKNEIGVLTIDGRHKKTLLTDNLRNPRSLAIDFANGHLYYSDWARESPKIGRMNLDGTSNQIFISDDIHLPNGIVILPNKRWLCWVDAGNQKLSCIGLNGKDRRVVYAPLEYPFGLTCIGEERFYWTDWRNYKVMSVNVYGSGYQEWVPRVGGKGKMYGILGVPLKCQGAPNACQENGCDQKHICLPKEHGKKCVCPDNIADCLPV